MKNIDQRKPLRAREWSYIQLLHCFSSSCSKQPHFCIPKCYLNLRGFHGNYFFNTFQNVLDFFYFSSFLVPFLEYFGLNKSLTSYIKKDTQKDLKLKSHLILNLTAFSENLEMRYCNTLANLYLKTYHRLWDYQQQPPTS